MRRAVAEKKKGDMEPFLGSWKLESNEGLTELLTRLGAGFITRKAQNASKPIITFAREKGPNGAEGVEMFSLKTTSTLKTSSCTFRIGYAFDENTMDGRTVRTVFILDGPTLKQEQNGTKTTNVTYTVDGDLLKTVIKVEDITCFRNYRRVVPNQTSNGTEQPAKNQETTSASSTTTASTGKNQPAPTK